MYKAVGHNTRGGKAASAGPRGGNNTNSAGGGRGGGRDDDDDYFGGGTCMFKFSLIADRYVQRVGTSYVYLIVYALLYLRISYSTQTHITL